MKYLKISVLLIITSLLVYNCSDSSNDKKSNNDTEEVVAEPVEPIGDDVQKRTLDSLNIAMNFYWDTLTALDNEKFKSIERLFVEIESNQAHSAFELRKLKKELKKVKKLQYDRSSMTDEDIARYDAATDSLISDINDYVVNTNGMENYPFAAQLIDEIAYLNGDVLIRFRTLYSLTALEYNNYVTDNKEELQENGLETKTYTTFFLDSE